MAWSRPLSAVASAKVEAQINRLKPRTVLVAELAQAIRCRRTEPRSARSRNNTVVFSEIVARNAGLETVLWLRYEPTMKMTFAIPDELGRRFRQTVPAGERSAIVADFLRKKLRPSAPALEAACRRVNKLKALERDMAGWESFDDQTP